MPVNNFSNEVGSVDTITAQIQQSSNCAFVRLGQIVGIDELIKQARKLGVTTTKLSPVSVDAAGHTGGAAAGHGRGHGVRRRRLHATPYYMDRVEDSTGKTSSATTPP